MKAVKYCKNLYSIFGSLSILIVPLNAIVWLTDSIKTKISSIIPEMTQEVITRDKLESVRRPYGLFYTHALDVQAYRIVYNQDGFNGLLFAMCTGAKKFSIATAIILVSPVLYIGVLFREARRTNLIIGLIGYLRFLSSIPMIVTFTAATIVNNCARSIVAELRSLSFGRGNTPEYNYVLLLHKQFKANILDDEITIQRDRLALGIDDYNASKIAEILRLPTRYITNTHSVQNIKLPVAQGIANAIENIPLDLKSIGFSVIENAVRPVRILAGSLPKCIETLQELYIDCLRVKDPGMNTISGDSQPSEFESLRIIVDSLPFNNTIKLFSVEMRQITYEIAVLISEAIKKCQALNSFSLKWFALDSDGLKIISEALLAKNALSTLSFVNLRPSRLDSEMQIILNTCRNINSLRDFVCHVHTTPELTQDLYSFINDNKMIESVSLNLFSSAKKYVLDTIATNVTLKKLHLKRFSDDDIQPLSNALKTNLRTNLQLITSDCEYWVRDADVRKAIESINAYRTSVTIGWNYFRKEKSAMFPTEVIDIIEKFVGPKRNLAMRHKAWID